MNEPPRLPSLYRLVTVPAGSDVRAAAARLARGSTDDGTLVWAQSRQDDRVADEDLHLALVLYPGSDLRSASQLAYVAALGLVDGLGSILPAGHDLTLEWPTIVLLNGGKLAEFTLDYPADGDGAHVAWIVLGLRVNISPPPGSSVLDTAALRDEAWPEATASALLQQFARHFLGWVNRWLDDGFEPVRAMWLRHTTNVGKAIEVPLENTRAKGVFVDLDADGCLVLKARNGRRRRIELRETPFASALAG